MYRPLRLVLPLALTGLLLNGCATTDTLFGTRAEADSSPEAPPRHEQERQALFEQPYIDPLTDYLIEHNSDSARQALLKEIRQERDRRCEEVAADFAREPATREALERFDTGYAYSCPQQVSAFEERVKAQPKTQPESPASTIEPETRPIDRISDQALSDCYLLTRIRNFSAAREACRGPAEKGDTRAQANLALVAHAFEDYSTALEWAKKAAPDSGDAAFLLAQMYAHGRGVNQNPDRALHWYTEAARLGHPEAQTELDRYRERP